MASTTYYVKASLDAAQKFAVCQYFKNADGTDPVPEGEALTISKTAPSCTVNLIQSPELLLIGVVYKTLGNEPVLTAGNFQPASNDNSVEVRMPTDKVVTKGVVLMFSNSGGAVECLYPSDDPEIRNNGD